MKKKPESGANTWVDPDDAPKLTEDFFRHADVYDGAKLVRRGRPPSATTKQLVSVRLDRDVLQGLRDLGPGWQTRANDALREFLNQIAKR